MTHASLRALTRKALANYAKKHQIAGWHEMTKDELVAALAASFRRHRARNGGSASRRSRNGRSAPGGSTRRGERSSDARPAADRLQKKEERTLGGGHLNGRRLLQPTVCAKAPPDVRDSLVVEAPDPCWLHVRWTLSRDTVRRAEAALGAQWHRAVPVLRLFDVTGFNERGDDAGTAAQTRLREVEIHGDVDHWYVPVDNAPRTYKLQIGFRAPSGLFFAMAHSNRVHTPRPDSYSLKTRANGRHRHGNGESRAPLELEKTPSYDLRALPAASRRGGASAAAPRVDAEGQVLPDPPVPVELKLHAELIVHGTTDPQAELKLFGDRIPVSRDGTFSHRLSLAEGRQVIDAVVTTRNRCHQRTIVLGIERNTKELEPQWFDDIDG